MKDRLTLFTKYLLDMLFYAGIVVTVTLPLGIRFYGKYDSYFGQHWLRLTILFGISGIFALILLQELRKMFKTVLNGDCFIRENVKADGNLQFLHCGSYCAAPVSLSDPCGTDHDPGICDCGTFFSGAVPGL